MKQRVLGRTGFEVSEVGFGAWAIGGGWGQQNDDDSIAGLQRALDLGVNFIDTAAVYGDGKSERLIASVLREHQGKVMVATKTPPVLPGPWPPSPYCTWQDRYPEKHLRKNVESRLKTLGVECLDLLQLHTWTRAWNRDPEPLLILNKLKTEGKLRYVGVSTPEHDQNAVIDLMRAGLVDTVQVIYNLFEQEPAAELLPVAQACNVGVIVRVAFDEGVLAGKYSEETTFAEDDFRHRYFEGDRLNRAVQRTNAIRDDIQGSGYSLSEFALKYVLANPAVSCVIPGMRNRVQAESNCRVSALPDISESLISQMRAHRWLRSFWYSGK